MTDIKGYKQLTEHQIAHMNAVKQQEQDFLLLLKSFFDYAQDYSLDPRWVSIARTHIEQASMAACRAITQPETVVF